MFYRAVAAIIVLFWLTMTALLLRNELQPGDSALREIPFAHVIKLLFLHEQPSDLNIYSDKLRLGHIRLHPQIDSQTHARKIDYSGSLQFVLPGTRRRRVAWDGELQMDKSLQTRRFRFGLTMHDPMDLRSEITVLPEEKLARYELRSATGTLERQDYSFDEEGARQMLRQIGLDPALLVATRAQNGAPPRIKAQQSSMKIHDESITTYLVTIEYHGQTFLELHVSQLGQILRANTLLGYTLVPDDIMP